MSAFSKLKVFVLFVACLLFAQLVMNYGYATYLPEFGSRINADYIATMRFHFSGLGVACALVTFFLSKFFLLKFKVSLLIFVLSGIVFNLYSPEGNQYHWTDGYIELTVLYLFSGLLVLYLLNFMKKSV
jgi:hypothetical protein